MNFPDPPAGEMGRARGNLAILDRLDQLGPDATATDLTDEDRELLGRWCGWGPMAKAIDPRADGSWHELHERLSRLITPGQLAAALQSCPTSFYTSNHVIDSMWRLATGLGFTGGRVLEPGCGHGRFIAAAPGTAQVTGVEIDETTARLAQLLNPQATIMNGRLEGTALPPSGFDLVIGNVPFSDVMITDLAMMPREDKWADAPKMSVHNYFLNRAVDAVRPGGFVIAVTSRYTLDADSPHSRMRLGLKADLVGAIRLPAKAFAEFGTDVVTDILILRKRPTGDPVADVSWHETMWIDDPGTLVNCYFAYNRERMLGIPVLARGQYKRNELSIEPTGDLPRELDQAVNELIVELAPVAYQPPSPKLRLVGPDERAPIDLDTLEPAPDGAKEGSFALLRGKAYMVENGRLRAVTPNKELPYLIRLRDALIEVLRAEADLDRSDASIMPLRDVLNEQYDIYLAKFGPVNRCTWSEGKDDPETGIATMIRTRPRMGGFKSDPDYVTLLAVELYDEDTGISYKGPIFTERVNKRPIPVTSVDSVPEAVAISIDRHGRIELATVASLLGVSVDEVTDQLGGSAYEDPITKRWLPADEYLSGNVRTKLIDARIACADDPARWHSNVAALTAVHPADLTPEEIRVQLGAPWVPVEDVQLFIRELLHNNRVKVEHSKLMATWEVTVVAAERSQPISSVTWGTGRADAYKLIEKALNADTIVVYDTVQTVDGEKKVRNPEETMLASSKMADIQEQFGEWIWEDPKRSDRLAKLYNDRFNSHVLRTFNGEHLTFKGMSAAFHPYKSQLDMVYRIISTPASLCGHAVGGGKTGIMAMACMKLRELGLAKKPWVGVPNHLLEQVARDFKLIFPMSNVLMCSSEDTTAAKRRSFLAKAALGDWDAVIITHSAFTSISVGDEVEQAFLGEQIADYRQALMDEDGGAKSIKAISKQLEKYQGRHTELLNHRVETGEITFGMTGCDMIMADEAHYFKNLGFPTRVRGLSISSSKRAADLEMKLWFLRYRSNGARWGSLFTGTPVSNTLAEMFVLQKYLQPDRLAELEIDHFDAWAGAFVQFETKVEVAPDGGSFRVNRRPSMFQNVPELRKMLGEVADIKNKADLGLPGPKVVDRTIVIANTEELKSYVDELVIRAEWCRHNKPEPGGDNMLVVCTDGRKAALDLDLVGRYENGPGKIGDVVDNIYELWDATRNKPYLGVDGERSPLRGAMQIAFCDMGTPNAESAQVYGKVRRGLVAKGMPIERIRFIHDAKTNSAKSALFAECRAGKVSVLLGSTDKLGVGTNVQSRCIAIHHIDAPWRPADVDQREGRGDRPGNQNAVLQIVRYVREGSFDAYMWQALERKARFIAQVLTGEITAREVQDIGDMVLTYTEVKALATGNPLLLKHAEVRAEVVRLRQLATAHRRGQRRVAESIEHANARADAFDKEAKLWYDLDSRQDNSGWRSDRFDRSPGVIDPMVIADSIVDQLVQLTESGDDLRTGRARAIGHYNGLWIEAVMTTGFRQLDIRLQARMGALDAVPLANFKEAWLSTGQRHKISAAVIGRFAEATQKADQLTMMAEKSRAEADTMADEYKDFPHALELAAAERAEDELEREMKEVAA